MAARMDKFTERARDVLRLAQGEAVGLHHPFIGTEHLLLGLVRDGEGVAAGVLESVGIDLERVRTEVRRVLVSMELRRSVLDSDQMVVLPSIEARNAPGGAASTLGQPSFTAGLSLGLSLSPEVRALLVRAFADAQRRCHATVTPAHFLLELVPPGEPLATALEAAGVDLGRLRAVAESLLAETTDASARDPFAPDENQPSE